MPTVTQRQIRSDITFLPLSNPNPHAPLFLLLPGMDGTGQLLKLQAQYLQRDFEVRGLSIPLDDRSTWQTLTQAVIDWADAERSRHPHRPIYLAGESFGGCLALQLAWQAPKLWEQLILINPASSFHQRPLLGLGTYLTQWTPNFLYQFSSLAFLMILAALDRVAPAERRQLLEVVRLVPQGTSAWRIGLLQKFYFSSQQLQQIRQPTLVIAGGADRLLPSRSEAHRLVRLLPNAKMVLLPKSGHACLIEQGINLHEILRCADVE